MLSKMDRSPTLDDRNSHVRFGSEADMCGARGDVRFTPNSDRESGRPQTVMSALPLKADMCIARGHVRYWPIADIALFDHLVGGREQRSWHDKAESLGSFEVDRKLVSRRLLKR